MISEIAYLIKIEYEVIKRIGNIGKFAILELKIRIIKIANFLLYKLYYKK